MKKNIRFLFLLGALLWQAAAHAQFTDKEQAELYAKQALIFEDQGKINEALELLKKAEKMDTTVIMYSYEVAFAYNLLKDYKQVTTILEKLILRPDANGKIYQLLGNTYDNTGQPARAQQTYEEGLKRFPNAGELYLEIGNGLQRKKDFKAAVSTYERGIKGDPMFASNYYWAAKLFLASNEKVWGMLYGELFLLLEYNSKRTAEMSRLLYLTCKNQISANPDGTYAVQLGTSTLPDSVANLDPVNKKLPFSKSVYEPLLALGLKGEKILDINSLSRARKIFTEYYFNTDIFQNYPNVLMDYQYKLLKSGHLEAYNHWVLAEGNHVDFEKWQNANKVKYSKFLKWFLANPLKLDDKYKFYREQY